MSQQPDGPPAANPQSRPDRPLVYRVIRRSEPRLQDFRSDAEKGKPPVPLQVRDRRLYTGISAYAPRAHAARKAIDNHLGNYLAELKVPEHVGLDETLIAGHYTVQGTAQQRLDMVQAILKVDSVLKDPAR